MKQSAFTYFLNGKPYGFTLAELLIALAILGVIATFTIPKVLNTQQDNKYSSMAKEVMGMMSEAYLAYKTEGGNPYLTHGDLTPYFNYVNLEPTAQFNNRTGGSITCNGGTPVCMRLHNGGILAYWNIDRFCSDNTPSAIGFSFDPDGKYIAGDQSLEIYVYLNRMIRTRGTIEPNTTWSNNGDTLCDATVSADPANEASWFSWD